MKGTETIRTAFSRIFESLTTDLIKFFAQWALKQAEVSLIEPNLGPLIAGLAKMIPIDVAQATAGGDRLVRPDPRPGRRRRRGRRSARRSPGSRRTISAPGRCRATWWPMFIGAK